MALVTPTCLLLGVCFPDIAKRGLPYVPAAKEEKILTTSQALNLLKLRGYVIKDAPLPTS